MFSSRSLLLREQHAQRAVDMVNLLACVCDFSERAAPRDSTVLGCAAKVPCAEFVRAFLPHCDPHLRDRANLFTPLMVAAASENLAGAQVLAPVSDLSASAPTGLRSRGVTALDFALAAASYAPTPSRDLFSLVELLAGDHLSDKTREALAKHGPGALPRLAAIAEREALEKALRPSMARRALKAFSALSHRFFGSPAPSDAPSASMPNAIVENAAPPRVQPSRARRL